MRFFAFLIEVLLPFLLIGTVTFSIYKFIKIKTSYKEWKITHEKNKVNRNNIAFEEMTEDWNHFINTFKSNLPATSLKNLNSISEDLGNLLIKSQKEQWNSNPNKKPKNIYLVADIIYKHAPELVDEFVQIPKSIAEKKLNYQGKNATELLNENTLILAKSFKEIIDQLFDENLQHLSAQQIHFKNKFGQDEKEMEL